MTTLNELITSLTADEPTITIDGVIAELSRQKYYDNYSTFANTPQFIPIINYNIDNDEFSTSNTSSLSFTYYDINESIDWICTNANSTS